MGESDRGGVGWGGVGWGGVGRKRERDLDNPYDI